MTRPLYLYGPPASGKTTLGALLAKALDMSFVDLDAFIAENSGMSIPAIFAAEGERGFRVRETNALKALGAFPQVVALGGGTLLADENRAFCERTGAILCLDAPDAAERARRFAAAPTSRPLGDTTCERADHYASFPHRLTAFCTVGDSLVLVGSSFARDLTAEWPRVMDANVRRLYAADEDVLAEIPSGERHKTLESVSSLWQCFADAGLGRRDIVCAIGGGVTGDLTGFAAATWMRGMPWVNVPTTLLAMVDASVGGKTGCDLPFGKNLVGAFHAPRLVAIDTDFLKTLPPARLADGRAEMIKHEIVGGIPPADRLDAAEIARNLKVKIDIVREDPLERTGRRLLLNCGHTVAHAVETLTHYAVSHGEAVAIGCVAEARLAVQRGLAPETWPAELAARFAAVVLPTNLPDALTFERLIPLMRGDKKRAGNTVTFALPCGWGDVRPEPIAL